MAAPVRREDIQPAILKRLDERQRRPAAPEAVHVAYPDGTTMISMGVFADGFTGIRIYDADGTTILGQLGG